MFEKLFTLVKNNAGTAVIQNPLISVKHHEAIINEASSSIIDVLQGQVEKGKMNDLVTHFQFQGVYTNHPLISTAVNKFANRLNNYYGLEPSEATATSKGLIPRVMQQLATQSQRSTDLQLNDLLDIIVQSKAKATKRLSVA